MGFLEGLKNTTKSVAKSIAKSMYIKMDNNIRQAKRDREHGKISEEEYHQTFNNAETIKSYCLNINPNIKHDEEEEEEWIMD